jgi:chemotaxis protein methyltransferase CheR
MRPAGRDAAFAASAREFPFTQEHFDHISERIYKFAGIRLPTAKREMVYARLTRRLRALGIGSFDDYVRFLELEPAEWEHCTNALTTNVTAFYREEHHFTVLAHHAREHARDGEPFRVWSAGCSTGEEPYTIAMCLTDAIPGRDFRVVATDLDTQVIAHARSGIYPLAAVLKLPEARQKRFFLRGTGRHEGQARVRREIAAHVEFRRLNLMDAEWPIDGPFDAIFCRNVMIYFDKPTQHRLVERFARMLAPHGLFFAGHAVDSL